MLDYSAGPFEQKVRGMDVVINTVGGDPPQRSLQMLRRGGVLVTVAARLAEGFGKAEVVQGSGHGRGRIVLHITD